MELLRRTTRSVAPTEAGELVAARARAVLAETDALRGDLDELRGLTRGHVNVGAMLFGLGWGKHFCLGGDLSRLETRILLQEALHRLPGLDLDEEKPFVRFAGIVDGVTEAWFRFDADAALAQTRLAVASA